jgi:hypothetical protein
MGHNISDLKVCNCIAKRYLMRSVGFGDYTRLSWG